MPKRKEGGGEGGEEMKKEIREKRADIFSFDEGMREVAKRCQDLLKEKDLVTFTVYGNPNAGKTTFAAAVMEEIRRIAGDQRIMGGEVKGYDELPQEWLRAMYPRWVMLIQEVITPHPHRAVNERVEEIERGQSGMPVADGRIWIVAPETTEAEIQRRSGGVDMVVKNPAAKRK